MKTFPAIFTVEKNKKTGAKPIWIARLIAPDADYYLAGRVISIPGFVGSSVWPASTPVNTVAWVSSFGNIVEGINGALDEFKVSEMSISTINDPEAIVNMETLVLAGIEGCVVELYEWFAGCSDPPQRIFVGKVRAITDYNDTIITFAIQDDTIDLEKFYIGTKLSLNAFSNSDPKDVGKIYPIPFGTVLKIPALCIQNQSPLWVYLFSAIEGSAITKVYARKAGMDDIDITSYCNTYNGGILNRFNSLPYGIITISNTQAIEIQNIFASKIIINDAGHSHITGTINSTSQNTNRSLPVTINGGGTGDIIFNFDYVAGTRSKIEYSVTATLLSASNGHTVYIYVNGVSVGFIDDGSWTVGSSRTFTGSVAATLTGDTITIGTSFLAMQVTAVARVVYYGTLINDNITGITADISQPVIAGVGFDTVLVDTIAPCGTNIEAGSYITNLAGKSSYTL